jgi:hypothetical protein
VASRLPAEELGGLGLHNLRVMNTALRTWWLWLQKTNSVRPWSGLDLHVGQSSTAFFHASVRITLGEGCNTPTTPGRACTPDSSLGSLDLPHRPTHVFPSHFVLTRVNPGTTSRSVTHPHITPGQARLTSEFFGDELLENKLQLFGMSILSILLISPGPRCHKTTTIASTCIFLRCTSRRICLD